MQINILIAAPIMLKNTRVPLSTPSPKLLSHQKKKTNITKHAYLNNHSYQHHSHDRPANYTWQKYSWTESSFHTS